MLHNIKWVPLFLALSACANSTGLVEDADIPYDAKYSPKIPESKNNRSAWLPCPTGPGMRLFGFYKEGSNPLFYCAEKEDDISRPTNNSIIVDTFGNHPPPPPMPMPPMMAGD